MKRTKRNIADVKKQDIIEGPHTEGIRTYDSGRR